ncbi:hypothetical protein CEW46_26930 [Bacillus cereus]|nr:hypothetical protein CEW46_26930 [Bacillus cereus]
MLGIFKVSDYETVAAKDMEQAKQYAKDELNYTDEDLEDARRLDANKNYVWMDRDQVALVPGVSLIHYEQKQYDGEVVLLKVPYALGLKVYAEAYPETEAPYLISVND